jgi:7-cyano-7-deazaguanine synthase
VTQLLLLSGGMDSIALAWWLRPRFALTVDYGQRPAASELGAASTVALALGIEHLTVAVNASALGTGDLAGLPPATVAPVPEWWPFRNQFLLTIAGMVAVQAGVDELVVGAVASDGAHADGRAAFLEGISELMEMQEGSIRVRAPALTLTAAELVRLSGVPIEVLSWAHSCHTGPAACGACRGCIKHFQTWRELGWQPY